MARMQIDSLEEMRALVGERIGPTEWRTVSQEDIDAFARLSGDRQWIHVDTERAARESPFGTTIAHGNLTLSLIDGFRDELMDSPLARLGVNYGYDRVRFPGPVPAGSRVRGIAEPVSVEEVGDGWWQLVTRFVVEVEGRDRPGCVADNIVRIVPA